jgi:hypothetical protein
LFNLAVMLPRLGLTSPAPVLEHILLLSDEYGGK